MIAAGERRGTSPGAATGREALRGPVAVADTAFVRVAMLPYAELTALVPAPFRALLAQTVEARERTRQAAAALAQALHGVVPQCPDARTRRAVLAIRRELFGDAVRDPDAVREILRSFPLDVEIAALGRRWSDADRDARAAGAELNAGWETARSFGVARLRALLERPEIGSAVAVASPELLDMLDRSDRAKRARAELSLARYVTRAATKTSPFSTLTGVVATSFGAGEHAELDLPDVAWSTAVRVNRALFAAADYAASDRLAARPDALVVRTESFAALVNGRAEWLEPAYFAFGGRPWRAGRLVSVRLHPSIANVLLGLAGPVRIDELDAGLQRLGLTHEKAAALIAMLLRRGALRNAAAPDAFTVTPDASLAAGGGLLALHVTALREAATELGRMRGRARQRAVTDAQRAADALLTAAGVQGLALKNVLLETCTGAAHVAVASEATRRILADVGRVLQRRIAINPLYGVLREVFLTTAGPNGSVDLKTFVGHANGLCADAAKLARLKAAVLRLPAPAVPAPFTVFGQLCAPGGDARFVVNTIVAGTGQLAARYAAADIDPSGAVRDRLAAWLARCAGDAVATDVTLGGDCNDLQSHPPLTERILPWSGDFVQPQHAGVDRGEDLFVTYDTGKHALRVRDRAGRARALQYLGAVHLNAAYGAECLLQAFGQPYLAPLPDATPPTDGDGEIVARERAVEDGIVLARARWFVRSDALRGWFTHGDARDLVEVGRACARWNIPRQFFAKAVVAGARHRVDAPLDARKPQWIDSENPLCLALLRRLLDVSAWIEFTEMLPTPRSLTRIGGAEHAAELQFEIIV